MAKHRAPFGIAAKIIDRTIPRALPGRHHPVWGPEAAATPTPTPTVTIEGFHAEDEPCTICDAVDALVARKAVAA